MKALDGFREGHELTTKLSDLYANLNSKDKKSISASAKPFKRVVDKLTDRFHGFQQRDAHDYLGEVTREAHRVRRVLQGGPAARPAKFCMTTFQIWFFEIAKFQNLCCVV